MSKIDEVTLVLTANENLRAYDCNGWFFVLLSNDQATDVKVGIDSSENLIDWSVWRTYEENTPDKRFNKIYFTNPTASVMTITFYVSEGKVGTATEYGSLTSIANLLTTIDGVLDNLLSAQDVPDTPTAIPATDTLSGGDVQLVTASANIRRIALQADYENNSASPVYLGFTTGVNADNAFARLDPGTPVNIDGNVNVWAYCADDSNKVRGYIIATA